MQVRNEVRAKVLERGGELLREQIHDDANERANNDERQNHFKVFRKAFGLLIHGVWSLGLCRGSVFLKTGVQVNSVKARLQGFAGAFALVS
jgi:hypothetical protein